MPIIEKLTIPPLYTHSIDYDNNLTIYEAYGAMLHTLNETIDNLNNVTQNLLPALTNRVSENEKNISLLLEYVDTLQQQMSTLLNTTIPAINSTLSQHNSRITVNESAIAKIKNDIISINTALTTINSRLNTIDTKISNLENNYTSLNFLVNHHTEEIITINSKIEEIQTVLADFNTKITANENSILNINTEISEINQKIDALNIDDLNALLQQIKADIDTANSIITQFSELTSSSMILANDIISITDIKIGENVVQKNGKLCNLRLKITNMGNFFNRNTYNKIGLFPLDYFPITVENNNYTYVGNCVISQKYYEKSTPLSSDIIYQPGTIWAKSDGKSVIMAIIVQFPEHYITQNNALYINMQYFVKE